MKRTTWMLAPLALVLTITGHATADTINFAAYGGQSVSSIDGVTFSLIGGPGPGGTPYVENDFFPGPGLTNSPNGNYPTSTILDFHFSTPVSNVSGFFDNEGTSFGGGRGASFYQAFDANGNLLEQGPLPSNFPPPASLPFALTASGIVDLQFNNGTGGSDSWIFAVNSISFTPNGVSATPEPASLTMLGLGVLGIGGYAWRRRKGAPAAAAC